MQGVDEDEMSIQSEENDKGAAYTVPFHYNKKS
jgi:hypothetical protein